MKFSKSQIITNYRIVLFSYVIHSLFLVFTFSEIKTIKNGYTSPLSFHLSTFCKAQGFDVVDWRGYLMLPIWYKPWMFLFFNIFQSAWLQGVLNIRIIHVRGHILKQDFLHNIFLHNNINNGKNKFWNNC